MPKIFRTQVEQGQGGEDNDEEGEEDDDEGEEEDNDVYE